MCNQQKFLLASFCGKFQNLNPWICCVSDPSFSFCSNGARTPTDFMCTCQHDTNACQNLAVYFEQLGLNFSSICFSVFKRITARKRSLGQGNIFCSVCQEFCTAGGGLASVHAGIPPPLTRHAPGTDTPPGPGTPPRADTPQTRHPHPPEQAPPPLHSASWEIRSTSGRYASYWNAILLQILLPSLEQGDVFTHVCHSVPGGGVGLASQHASQVILPASGGLLPSMHHRSHDQRGPHRGGGLHSGGKGPASRGGSVSKEEGVCIQWGWADPPSPPSSAGTRKAGGRILLECFLVLI